MNVLKCSLCKKIFKKTFNLKRHIQKFHPDQADTLVSPKKTFLCRCCDAIFPTLKELKVHKKIHNKKAAPVPKCNKCPLCDYSDYQKKNLLPHFTEQHEITLKYSHHSFSSFNEFKVWVTETENETKARYVKRRKTDITKAGQTIHYGCHRSGNFISESKGLRRLKVQGSHKIDGFCPGEIKVFIKPNGLCEVTFSETHVGHENEVERLYLRQSEREVIANKIAQNIPFKEILTEVRNSADNSQRIHLIKRKDLYNIEQSFKLQTTSPDQNSGTFVDEIQDDDLILFHKTQETINNVHPELNFEDFVLILMNEEQEEMLIKYGSDCVCFDRIHGQNHNDFELHTLSVLDNNQDGFPCAFLISNRNDEQVMTIFLFYVKQKIGMAVAPKVFMSDMAECYYAAWLNVMVQPQLRFYCMWHIANAWKSNLFKINGKEKQDTVYKSLRTMLYETDVVVFTSLLAQFFKNIYNDPDTLDFGDYFKDNYENSAGQWAFCFRLRYGVDTNKKLEHLHNSIKKLYLSGDKVKRLDRAISAIIKFVSEKFANCKRESDTNVSEPETGSTTIQANVVIEHAYAGTQACHDDLVTDDPMYVDYVHYEESVDEETKYVMEIHNNCEIMKINDPGCSSLEDPVDEESEYVSSNSELMDINDPGCTLLIDQEKAELEASMVKIIREINCIEQIKVFKALMAPIEPAMKAIAEENLEVQNRNLCSVDYVQLEIEETIPER